MTTTDPNGAEAYLKGLAATPDDRIDLADAALMFAALDRPRVSLERYHQHLAALARTVAETIENDELDARVTAVNHVLYMREGYDGDRLTYDDLQNANLMRVIDRRRGLPVSLGILYIHVTRAQGWQVTGLSFPGHFILRLDGDGARAIVDPFDRGRELAAADLRELLKSMAGREVELHPSYYDPVGNREILIRLQNNIKLRHIQNGATDRACRVAERLLWIAPEEAQLWQDYGLLEAKLGNVDMAVAALETCLARSHDEQLSHSAARLLQEIATLHQ
ncbi:MAG: tetratricopeptide repeat protein [Alphaproteobacteria bacterium]|nr:tetratricopeptide repeat protein [Alphaproteobacteria bacterium]